MQDEKCAFYIAATEKLSESEKHEIEMDIKNAEIYLRNSENEKHRKITTTQPEYFDGIRSIPINQIEVPPCFKKNRPAEKKIDSMIEYYKERGHFDKPVTVVFRNDKYVLKDKFLRYYRMVQNGKSRPTNEKKKETEKEAERISEKRKSSSETTCSYN